MNWAIDRIIYFLVNASVLNPDDRDAVEIHRYGLYCFLSDILDFSCLFLVSSLFNLIPHTVVYYIAFIGLRRLAGGYHASTRIRCFVISMITWGISMWMILSFCHYRWLTAAITLMSCLPILYWAPIEHPNNPMSKTKIINKRKGSRIYTFILLGVTIALLLWSQNGIPLWLPASLAYGMIFFAGSLTVARLQEIHHVHKKAIR